LTELENKFLGFRLDGTVANAVILFFPRRRLGLGSGLWLDLEQGPLF